MDGVEVGMDADESSVDDGSQPTFNALIRGVEKCEELDAFLTQGDARNTLESGFDSFQPGKSLADDPHILESTLDSILGVNEEEEVEDDVCIDDDDELEHGFHDTRVTDEIEIKDAKKYNTRQRRRPNNDEMFVYESPSSVVINKREKIKKKQEPTASRGRGRGRSRVLREDHVSVGNVYDEKLTAIVTTKTETDAGCHSKSFEDRRLTRRQSLLTGIKPVSNTNVTCKESKSEDDRNSKRDSSVGTDDDDDETNSDVISNASQGKSKEIKTGQMNPEEVASMMIKQEIDVNEPCDDGINYNEKSFDGIASCKDDSLDLSMKCSPNVKMATTAIRKRGRPPKKFVDKLTESSDVPLHGDLKQEPAEQNESENETKVQSSCKVSQSGTNLFEIITSTPETNASKLESRPVENEIINEASMDDDGKDRKPILVVERKVESTPLKRVELEKDQEVKEACPETQKTRTISLETFVQNSTRKGRKTCRGPGCEVPMNPSQKSIYCSQNCTEKYSQYVLQVLAKERSKMGQEIVRQTNDRLVVLERQTGKILTGPAAPTEATLTAWLIRYPSFEVMLSSQSKLDERSGKKVQSEKKQLPAHLRDNPALTKDIRNMAAKLLGQKKEVDDANKMTTSSGEGASAQLKRPDPIRMSVRNALREALNSRANDCDDVMVSTNEIKSLAMDIEDELCKVCEGVTPKYKYKVKAIVTQIKDTSNKGFFRRLLFGELQPNQLVRMTNEKITSKELSEWNDDNPALSILGNDATFQPAFDNKPKSPPYQPIFDITLSATSETTSQHGTHFFDMNCKICTGKVPEPSYNPAPKSEANFGYYSKSMNETSLASYPLSPKPSLKMPLLPTPPATQNNPSNTNRTTTPSALSSKVTSQPDNDDDSLWTGTIYAREITSVRIHSYLISGSLSSPMAGSIKTIMQEDLNATIHMAGRVTPKSVFNFIIQLRSSGRLAKEIAVIYLLPVSSSENSFYQSLFSYLNTRGRLGLISPGVKREVGRIKDFYLMSLPANASPPAALLPFEGPGLPTNRGDLIIGIITKYASKPDVVAVDKVVQGTTPLQMSESSRAVVQESPSLETVGDPVDDDDDDNDSEIDNRVIFNTSQGASAKSDDPKSFTIKAKSTIKPIVESSLAAAEEDEPYEPSECFTLGRTSGRTSGSTSTLVNSQTPSRASVKRIPEKANVVRQASSRVNVITPSNMNMSILASDNMAATMLNTLSAVTNSTSLQEQQKMLQDLTQKINEQKIILQHQEKSIKRIPDTPINVNPVTPPTQPSVSLNDFGLGPLSTHVQPPKTSSTVLCPSGNFIDSRVEKHHSSDKEVELSMKTNAPIKIEPSVIGQDKNPTMSQTTQSGGVLASLPASINQFLSGETFKNLKNIMANMTTTSKQTEVSSSIPKIDGQYLIDPKLPFSASNTLGSSSVLANDPAEGGYKNVREPNISTNFHGDIDYRFEPKPSQENATTVEQQIFIPSPSLFSNALSDQIGQKAAAASIPVITVRKPLLATPPSLPTASKSCESIKNSNEKTQQPSKTEVHAFSSKDDSMVWKPLLPSSEKSNCNVSNKSRGCTSRKSDSPPLRRRDEWAEKGRSRDRKRKRSPDTNSSHEFKKNDRDAYNNKSSSEIKDDGDDVQIINDNSSVLEVIEIDEDDETPENGKARGRKTEQKGGSAERSRRRSRERSSSRSRRMRRSRRSRSPRNKHQSISARRSRSRSPVKRQTNCKIDPSNLPHNLSTLFPSLMQIVGGSNLSRNNEPSLVTLKSGIPSLLDMLDPNILPDRYKSKDGSGLLGMYKENEAFNPNPENVMESKPFKRGLLGDFPSQLNTDKNLGEDLEDSIDKNLTALRKVSEKPRSYERKGKHSEESNLTPNHHHDYKRQSGSHNSGPSFSKKVRESDHKADSKDVTVPSTSKRDEASILPPPPPPWGQMRNDVPPLANPPFPPPNYFMPGSMHMPMMPFPRGTEGRPFMRFPQPMMAPPSRPRGYFNGSQRPLRPPFRPPRLPKN